MPFVCIRFPPVSVDNLRKNSQAAFILGLFLVAIKEAADVAAAVSVFQVARDNVDAALGLALNGTTAASDA